MTALAADDPSLRVPFGVAGLSVALATVTFAFDVAMPLGVAGGVPYVALVLVGLWAPWRPYLLLLALAGSVLTVLGYLLSPPGGVEWVVFVNRGLALFAIWTTALLAFERKQSEERLRHSEGRHRAVLDGAVDGIITIDARGTIETVNPAIERIFGYKQDEIVGRNVKVLMPEPDRGKHDDYMARYLGGGEARIIGIGREVMAARKDGTIFPMDLSVNGVRLGDERKFVGILRDVTLRKRAEQALRAAHDRLDRQATRLAQANEALAEYASAVSHDLKGPLRAMRNYADFLREDLEHMVDEDQLGYLDGLGKAVGEAEDLVDDLLSYGQVSTRAAPFEEVDLGPAVRDMIGALALPDDCEIEVAEDWPTIETSLPLLRQIIHNLISNALKFNASEQKKVHLSWRMNSDDMCDISVTDNGIGIDSQYLEQIFQIFQRLHTKSEFDGTGIGLAIVKKAADRLGGNVSVESEPGKGSTFVVSLPLKRTEQHDDG